MLLQLEEIRVDEGVQAREGTDQETVEEYARARREGASFPPVVVFQDGTVYWLADGFHRLAAARLSGLHQIEADIRVGGRRDAILFAAGANATHGLGRTNVDKRKAVLILLRDEEWKQWSDREIARRCGVSHTLVAGLRKELSGNGCQIQERRAQRGGVTYPIDTTNIGKGGKRGPEELSPGGEQPKSGQSRREDILNHNCEKCGEAFDRPVWHCPGCDAHRPAEEVECGECESARPAITREWVVVAGTLYQTPFAGLLPDLNGEVYESFKESVRRAGIRSRILVNEQNCVIDGRQRLRAASELGIDPPLDVRAGLSPRDMFKLFDGYNLLRANYSDKQLEESDRRHAALVARYTNRRDRTP